MNRLTLNTRKTVTVKHILTILSLLLSQAAISDASADKIVKKTIIKIIDCGNKKYEIIDYVYKEEIKSIYNTINGIFYNMWLSYTDSRYYGEANNYFMVNMNTCEIFEVDGPNIHFLDENHFLTWSIDFEAHYSPNQISIYSINKDMIKKEDEFLPADGGPKNAKWIDNNTINFTHVTFNKNKTINQDDYLYEIKNIIRKNGEWLPEQPTRETH